MSIDDAQSTQLKTWLVAAGRHDVAAFRSLYEATSAKLFAFVLRILMKRELAEEALQESFVNIWNSASGYQPSVAAPMTWMTTIARNKAFDILRRREDAVEIDADTFEGEVTAALESKDPTLIEALQLSDNARALARCLAQLEGPHRQAIAFAFYHDLSHKEVADRMKLSLGTIKTWIRRGLERLRLCLSRPEGA